jgi:hypothetical protein
MIVILIVLFPLTFVVAGWAWRYQLRVLALTSPGLSRMAGQPGAVADIQVTSVLVDETTILVGFRPADQARVPQKSIVLSRGEDDQATLARLHRWEASGATVTMWRDSSGRQIELSTPRMSQTMTLSVVALRPAAKAGSAEARGAKSSRNN